MATKHTLPVEPIVGEFRYPYASACGVNQPLKRLYFTVNISEFGVAPYVTFDVEIGDKIYPFTDQLAAIRYYNNF